MSNDFKNIGTLSPEAYAAYENRNKQQASGNWVPGSSEDGTTVRTYPKGSSTPTPDPPGWRISGTPDPTKMANPIPNIEIIEKIPPVQPKYQELSESQTFGAKLESSATSTQLRRTISLDLTTPKETPTENAEMQGIRLSSSERPRSISEYYSSNNFGYKNSETQAYVGTRNLLPPSSYGSPIPIHSKPQTLSQLRGNSNIHILFDQDSKGKIISCKNLDAGNETWGWNSTLFVKMPCSSENNIKWNIIGQELLKFQSFFEHGNTERNLAEAMRNVIKSYNAAAAGQCDFEICQWINGTKVNKMIPNLVSQVLKLSQLVHHSIPFLKAGQNKIIFASQEQVFSLLANAFFCTFPKRSPANKYPKFGNLPRINFFELLHQGYNNAQGTNSKAEKLKCILHYFSQMLKRSGPGNVISYERRWLSQSEIPDWRNSAIKLTNVHVNTKDPIEIGGKGMLQVDFANKMVGGGTLGNGAVMEEIRFSICPELILSGLFTEMLGDLEVLVIHGCEQFSKYKGYGHTFTFDKSFEDKTELDHLGRLDTEIVAMDALHFSQSDKMNQFRRDCVTRELNKSYCAFKLPQLTASASARSKPKPVATGNWGCGVFNGDPELKFLIQWMAASQAGRDIHMFTFGSEKQSHAIQTVSNVLLSHNSTVKDVYRLLADYANVVSQGHKSSSLFEFILVQQVSFAQGKY